MKIKKLALIAMFNFALFTGTTHADIQLTLPHLPGEDACNRLAGNWQGDGQASASILTCKYSGTGKMTKLDTSGKYNMHVDLATKNWWPCKDVTQDLPALCKDNKISIATDTVSINGSIDGDTVSFKNGTIVLGGRTASIDYITLHKV